MTTSCTHVKYIEAASATFPCAFLPKRGWDRQVNGLQHDTHTLEIIISVPLDSDMVGF